MYPIQPAPSEEREAAVPEIPAEEPPRVGTEPIVEYSRVDGAEVRLVAHVAGAVFEGRVLRIGIQVRRRAVEAAVDATAHGHHHGCRPRVGPAAAVFADAPAEFREAEDKGVFEECLVAQ